MLQAELSDRVIDTISRNAIPHGAYIMISFHQDEAEPIVAFRGMNTRRWNIATYKLKEARKGGDNGQEVR